MAGRARFHTLVAEFKRMLLGHTLAAPGGNKSRAAALLGLQRTYFVRPWKQFRRHP